MAAVLSLAFAAIWAAQLVTIDDDPQPLLGRMLPAFAIVGALWLGLALTALVPAARAHVDARRVRVPLIATFTATGVNTAFALATLTL